MINSYSRRLHSVIPGGCHTYSRGDDQFPSNTPEIFSSGKGSKLYTKDGEEYLDYVMGLRSVTQGYAESSINNSAISAINLGNNLSRASFVELEAAELFTSLDKSFDKIKFCKNGSNATTAAIKLARSYTNKKYVIFPSQQPFFSFDDWFIGTTKLKRGIPQEHTSLSKTFDYGVIESVSNLYDLLNDDVAAIILEPWIPKLGIDIEKYHEWNSKFLQELRDLANKKGSVLIFDEMITGFRWSFPSAAGFYNIKGDLYTFGKAIANGFSVSCITGNEDIMSKGSILNSGTERTFLLSSTHGAEMSSLSALIQSIKNYQSHDIPGYLWKYSQKFCNGVNDLIDKYSLNKLMKISSPSLLASISFLDDQDSLKRTAFMYLLMEKKIVAFSGCFSFSTAHDENDLKKTLEAFEYAMEYIASGKDLNRCQTTKLKPVFRQFN